MEGRITRARQMEADAEISRGDPDHAPRADPRVFKTIAVSSYPTVATAYYAVQECDVSGPETEGGAATLTPFGSTLYAANVGASVPPAGTFVIGHPVPAGRLAFRYG